MRRKKCGLMGRLYICWKPHPRGLEPGHLSQVGDAGGTVSGALPLLQSLGVLGIRQTLSGVHVGMCAQIVSLAPLSRILVYRTESQKMNPEQTKTPTSWLSSWPTVWAQHARLMWVLSVSL